MTDTATRPICNQLPAWVRDALIAASKYPTEVGRMRAINAAHNDAKLKYPYLFQRHA